jgi:hypothetical protein
VSTEWGKSIGTPSTSIQVGELHVDAPRRMFTSMPSVRERDVFEAVFTGVVDTAAAEDERLANEKGLVAASGCTVEHAANDAITARHASTKTVAFFFMPFL